MLAKHTTPTADWKIINIYDRDELRSCWVIWVDGARFVPGDCSDCGGDTLVDLNTRRIDDGDCARCGAKGATVFFDGCRDSMTLLHFVAIALFGEEPEIKIEYDEQGLYYVTCPDCVDDRAGFADDHPNWEIDVPCVLCGSCGDLCRTMLIEKSDAPPVLAVKLAHRRSEVAVRR